jgi:ubiquitin-like 1-activating enzyme E1 B
MDHSEDVDNADEVANLRKEAQALKRIRESRGSDDFPRLVFDKVFKEDIERLRSMEDMWKTKRPPEALDYKELAKRLPNVGEAIVTQDQIVWNVDENFAVFVDSLKRLSDRLDEMRANADVGNAAAVLSFDKDDVDTLDFVVASANLRSHIFGIETRSKFDIKRKLWIACSQGDSLIQCRNGRQHYSCHSDNECHDCRSVRSSGIQGHA